jgi:hypothetical protein
MKIQYTRKIFACVAAAPAHCGTLGGPARAAGTTSSPRSDLPLTRLEAQHPGAPSAQKLYRPAANSILYYQIRLMRQVRLGLMRWARVLACARSGMSHALRHSPNGVIQTRLCLVAVQGPLLAMSLGAHHCTCLELDSSCPLQDKVLLCWAGASSWSLGPLRLAKIGACVSTCPLVALPFVRYCFLLAVRLITPLGD